MTAPFSPKPLPPYPSTGALTLVRVRREVDDLQHAVAYKTVTAGTWVGEAPRMPELLPLAQFAVIT